MNMRRACIILISFALIAAAQTNRTVNLPNLRQLVQTCDFEGHVTWVLGVGHPKRFRVVELTNPSRIVVDVKH